MDSSALYDEYMDGLEEGLDSFFENHSDLLEMSMKDAISLAWYEAWEKGARDSVRKSELIFDLSREKAKFQKEVRS